MEIRKVEIDLDNKELKINGQKYENKPIIVTLLGSDGWPLAIMLNAEQSTETLGECSELRVEYKEPNNRL